MHEYIQNLKILSSFFCILSLFETSLRPLQSICSSKKDWYPAHTAIINIIYLTIVKHLISILALVYIRVLELIGFKLPFKLGDESIVCVCYGLPGTNCDPCPSLQYGSDDFNQDSPRYTSPKPGGLYGDSYFMGKRVSCFMGGFICYLFISFYFLYTYFFLTRKETVQGQKINIYKKASIALS